MNTDDYISSNILQAYALGRLTAGECAEVEQRLTAHPELRGLLLQIKAAPKEQVSVTYRPKSRPPEKSGSTPPLHSRIRKLDPERSIRFWRIATAADIILALVTTYAAVTLQASLKQSQTAFREMLGRTLELTEEVRLAADLSGARGSYAADPAYNHIVLHDLGSSKTAELSLFWNQRSSEVFLQISAVPDQLRERPFQLWAIREGKPVSAGTFTMAPGTIKMSSIENATAFMVTRERKSGLNAFDPTHVILFGKSGG